MDLQERIKTIHDLDCLNTVIGNKYFANDDVKMLHAMCKHMDAKTKAKLWALFTPFVLEYVIAVDKKGLDFDKAKRILIELANEKGLVIESESKFEQMLEDARKAMF